LDRKQIAGRFEQAWQSGTAPRLEDYLPPVGIPERQALLIDLVHIDLRRRLTAGETVRVESYLERYPELANDPEVVFDLILAEYEVRCRREGSIPFTDYAQRFRRYRKDLRERWPARVGMTTDVVQSSRQARPPAEQTLPPDSLSSSPWPQIPDFEIEDELGAGGMGVVYRARQISLPRLVALKMLKDEAFARPEERALFRREAEAVARLGHPNIVQIYAFGEHEGHPYIALEFVDGSSLHRRLNGKPLAQREAAALLETLARAMHAAHQQQVVHRDLKPENVLLTVDGTPKITDFGLAKRLDTAQSLIGSGALVGTPPYMAPEQARGQSRAVGPATDVYALGAMLYEALTGRPPFQAATLLETLEQVINRDPVAVRQLQPQVARDLETICHKCLEKDPARRYHRTADLAEDLGCFLAGKPLLHARPVGKLERARKWCRRNPALAALLVVSGAALAALLILVVGLFFYTELQAAYQNANEERQRAEGAGRREATARASAEALRDAIALERAHSAWRENDLVRADQLLQQCAPERRRWEWRYLHRLCHTDLFTCRHTIAVSSVAFSPDGKYLASAGGPNTFLLNPDKPGELKVWDAESGKEVFSLDEPAGPVWSVAFSPDDPSGARRLATAGVAGVKVWAFRPDDPLRARRLQRLFSLAGRTTGVSTVCFSPDGIWLATAGAAGEGLEQFFPGKSGEVKLWDAQSGKEVLSFQGHTDLISSICFSPDGKYLAGAGGALDHTVKVWETKSGRLIHSLKGHTSMVAGVSWSPRGNRLASAGHDRTVAVWDVDKEKQVLSVKGQRLPIYSVCFSPDGTRLAGGSGNALLSGSSPGEVKVWDAGTGREILSFKGHTGSVTSVRFSPDGKRLASASDDKTVKLWPANKGQESLVLQGHTLPVRCVAFSPDGKRLASAGDAGGPLFAGKPGEVKVWDLETARELCSLQGHTREVSTVCFSPQPGSGRTGQRLASANTDGTVRLWEADTGKERRTLRGHSGKVTSVCFSPDGKRLASSGEDKTVKVWETDKEEAIFTLPGHTEGVRWVAFSPDGKRLASAGEDETVRVWDAQTGKEVLTLKGHTGTVTSVCFSPDGKRLATASADQFNADRPGEVKVWDAQTGAEVLSLKGHSEPVSSVCFSPDGTRLASVSAPGFRDLQNLFRYSEVKVWDSDRGLELLSLKLRSTTATSVCFSPDGNRLAYASGDQTVTVWEATPLPALPTPKGPRAPE
jgi:WD40 repeat protein